jgi:hypothetical protein
VSVKGAKMKSLNHKRTPERLKAAGKETRADSMRSKTIISTSFASGC